MSKGKRVENKTLALSMLQGHARNYNRHSETQIADLRASLQQFGQVRSVVVQANGGSRYTILAGHGIVAAAKQEGYKELRADVVPASWSKTKALAYLAADNELARRGDPDQDQLAAIVKEVLDAEGEALARLAAGEQSALDALLVRANPKEETADVGELVDKAGELQKKWQVARGDVWEIGKHRLMCGDSTSAEHVGRLMGREKFRLAFTSPPYSNQRDYEIGNFDWLALLVGVTGTLFDFASNPSDVVINLGLEHSDGKVHQYWQPWLEHCENIGHPLFGWYVWDQGEGYPGDYHGRLARAFEFVFHFSIGHAHANKWIETLYTPADAIREREHHRTGARTGSRQKDGSIAKFSANKVGQSHKIPDSVIRVDREKARGIHTQVHPATFSIAFADFVLRSWGDIGSIVYEPFMGAGTTLVACEQTGRIGRGMEISEKYCAVTLERLSLLGLTPKRIEQVAHGKTQGKNAAKLSQNREKRGRTRQKSEQPRQSATV